jgi:SAM-dependent methyltransferase
VNLPFEDGAFDVVFSSNVLEHVANLPALLEESMRVLRPGGYFVHVVPSATWRLWTTLTYYPDLIRRAAGTLFRVAARSKSHLGDTRKVAHHPRKTLSQRLVRLVVPPVHGMIGTVWTEMWHFRRRSWLTRLRAQDLEVVRVFGSGFFYSGSILFGLRMPFVIRRHLSHVLGSSTHIVILRKLAGTAPNDSAHRPQST